MGAIVKTDDGGYLIGCTLNGTNIDLGNNVYLSRHGYNDGAIIKYNANGEAEWANDIVGDSSDAISTVAQASDGGAFAGGYFSSYTIDCSNGVSCKNLGSQNGVVLKYNEKGEIEWADSIGGSSYDSVDAVIATNDGGCIAIANCSSQLIHYGKNNETIFNSSNEAYRDGLVIKYTATGEIEWIKKIGGEFSETLTCITLTVDGGFIVGGEFNSPKLDFGNGITIEKNNNAYTYENFGMMIKFSANGEVEWAKKVGDATSYNSIHSIKSTIDGGYIVGGFFLGNIELDNGETLVYTGGSGDAMLIKYSSDNSIEWYKTIWGTRSGNPSMGDERMGDVIQTSDDGYLVAVVSTSKSITIDNIKMTTYNENSGIIIKYDKNGTAEWAKLFGGAEGISANSIVEIEEGSYIVGGRTRSTSTDFGNDVKINSRGDFIVNYGEIAPTSVVVHHYLEGTTTKLADDVTIEGKSGDAYTTGPASLDSKYELVATPDNASGKMKKSQVEVNYYYKLKDTSVLVHHYKEGTTEKVSEDVTINGKVDDAYATSTATDIPEYYQLVSTPTNASGTMTEKQITVTYYYKLKSYLYTVRYLEKDTNKVLNAPSRSI